MTPKKKHSPSRGRPMRFRIARGLMALLLAVFAAIGIVTAERAQSGLNGSLDDSLDAMIEFAAQNAVLRMAPAAAPPPGVAGSPWQAGVEKTYFEVRSFDDGRVLIRSSPLGPDDNLLGDYSWSDVRRRIGRKGWNCRVQGEHLRCRAETVRLPDQDGDKEGRPPKRTVIVAGVERVEADRRFLEILERSIIVLTCALIVAVGGVWLVVWRATRPLTYLAEDVSFIEPDNIRPVRVPDDPQLSLLAQRLNRSLSAVSDSFQREKRFSSDVAHELLTPLGGLRAEIEVALMRPRTAEELGETVNRCEGMVVEIQSLVENLLELGRLEAGASRPKGERLSLREELDAVWAPLASAARERGVSFENRMAPDATLIASGHLLRIVLKNLLGNAVHYAPPGGRVWAETGRPEDYRVLGVLNEAANLPADFAQRAFDRFWRGDASRTRRSSPAGGGVGLGLAIARAAARAMGYDLSVEVRPGPVVCFFLGATAPVCPPPPSE